MGMAGGSFRWFYKPAGPFLLGGYLQISHRSDRSALSPS